MKMLVPLLLALALVASSARGCVGESVEDLAKRYGKQTKTGTSHLPGVTIQGYQFGAFQIVVGVIGGRSAFEMYSKRNQTKLNASEITALMNANGGGHAWNVDTTSKFEGTRWTLDDETMVTELPKEGKDLTVMSKEGADLLSADKPANKPTGTPAKK